MANEPPQTIEEEFAEFNRQNPTPAPRPVVAEPPRSQTPSFTTVLSTVWKTLMAVLLIAFLGLMAWAWLSN